MGFRQAKRFKQTGFTLVELIIVIVVIGILAAVAIPKLASVTSGATVAKNKATLGTVRTAWSVAAAASGTVPTLAQVLAQVKNPDGTACTSTNLEITCSGLVLTVTADPVPDPSAIQCKTTADCT